MRYLALLAVILLTACTSPAERAAKLDRWVGTSERELVTSWGVPDKTYDLDRRTRMLSYVDVRNYNYGTSFGTCMGGWSGRVGYNNCVGGMPPTRETHYCETTFMVVNGRVTKWGLKGSGC
ncbi:MAG TPA: hypothetical protein VEF76_07500 [Patescibacteria group bacterium]|nr:hypothetical protein [Patescibacteria group bacterium]